MASTAPHPPNVAEELKRIASAWPAVISQRDVHFQSPAGQRIRACIAPGFQAILDGYPDKLNWEQLLGVWQQELHDYPTCWLRLVDCHADVDEHEGTADVYLDMDMQFVEGIDLKAYTQLKWTREKDGSWLIRRFHGMRGNSGNAGFV